MTASGTVLGRTVNNTHLRTQLVFTGLGLCWFLAEYFQIFFRVQDHALPKLYLSVGWNEIKQHQKVGLFILWSILSYFKLCEVFKFGFQPVSCIIFLV